MKQEQKDLIALLIGSLLSILIALLIQNVYLIGAFFLVILFCVRNVLYRLFVKKENRT